MKHLEIKRGKGYYIINDIKKEIDQISKEDILLLVEILINKSDDENFEMDEYTEETLHNEVHKIIYSRIYNKLNELNKNKSSIFDDVNQMFQPAYQKYT